MPITIYKVSHKRRSTELPYDIKVNAYFPDNKSANEEIQALYALKLDLKVSKTIITVSTPEDLVKLVNNIVERRI